MREGVREGGSEPVCQSVSLSVREGWKERL